MDIKGDKTIPTLFIVDDQMDTKKMDLAQMFSVDCHHTNTSMILVTQNLFVNSSAYRTASLNAQYIIIFRSPRGPAQVMNLSRQLVTGKRAKCLVQSYEDATCRPYKYLLMDLRADTPDKLRFRADVLPDEGYDLGGHKLTRCYTV